ncbi:MAG: four helix bundle protein, partial [Deltaproteobacteria bacterium]|nr:four helix bundle protein [Deltaproteobacteria bacterium]
MPADEVPLFALWETVLHDLLARTAKFPKRVRFTLATRLDNLALDVFERLVEARYSRDRRAALQ